MEAVKESIIEQIYCSGNFPSPLFAYPKTGKEYQRAEFLPFVKPARRRQGREGRI
jgi:hypothetical protein